MRGIAQNGARQIDLMNRIIDQRSAFVIPPVVPTEVPTRIVRHLRGRTEPAVPVQSVRRRAIRFWRESGARQQIDNFDLYHAAELAAFDIVASGGGIGSAAILK